MEEVVNDGVESTTQGASTTPQATDVSANTQGQTSSLSTESVDSPSSEDVNTQSTGDSDDGLVNQALDEVQSPKGQGRVQQLANELKSAREELETLRSSQLDVMKQNLPYYSQYGVDANYLQEQKIAHLEESMFWDKFERANPDIAGDKFLYNHVYNEFQAARARGLNPNINQIVSGARQAYNQSVGKIREETERKVYEKQVVGSTSARSTEVHNPNADLQEQLAAARRDLRSSNTRGQDRVQQLARVRALRKQLENEQG